MEDRWDNYAENTPMSWRHVQSYAFVVSMWIDHFVGQKCCQIYYKNKIIQWNPICKLMKVNYIWSECRTNSRHEKYELSVHLRIDTGRMWYVFHGTHAYASCFGTRLITLFIGRWFSLPNIMELVLQLILACTVAIRAIVIRSRQSHQSTIFSVRKWASVASYLGRSLYSLTL